MNDLIKRLEQAEEGSEKLDQLIADAVLERSDSVRLEGSAIEIPTWRYPDGSKGSELRFSRSIDAALTLVPEGYLWELRQGIECKATVWCLERDYDIHPLPVGRHAKTPALALCIAALKARQET